MDCERALILISAALDGELSRQEQAELEEHLAVCPECRALSDDFGVLSVALSDMQAEPPRELLERVEAALDQEAAPVTARPRLRRKVWGSLAAMLALVVCLGGVYIWSGMGGMAGAGADNAAPAQRSQESGGGAAADAGVSSSQPEAPALYSGAASAEEESAPWEDQADPPDPSPSEAADGGETAGGEQLENAPADSQSAQEDAGAASGAAPNALTLSPAEGAEETRDEAITPLQALELVFSALGGTESYPDAGPRDEDPARYFLAYEEREDAQVSLLLEYSGLSANGLYHIVREYEYIVENGDSGWMHTATVNRYAVSLDGAGVMAERDADGSQAAAQAFQDAVGG